VAPEGPLALSSLARPKSYLSAETIDGAHHTRWRPVDAGRPCGQCREIEVRENHVEFGHECRVIELPAAHGARHSKSGWVLGTLFDPGW
jgi:hypothetical protein